MTFKVNDIVILWHTPDYKIQIVNDPELGLVGKAMNADNVFIDICDDMRLVV